MLVLHALTGDSHVRGSAGPGHPTEGWWHEIVGPGAAIDTDSWFVIAPNMLGGCQGSTGPSSIAPDGYEWASRFPYLTIRDQVAAQVRLADALGIDVWAAVIGGSMGGMHALEWAVGHPERVERVGVLSAPPVNTADQIALNSVQLEAIHIDPRFQGGEYYDSGDGDGPHRGLALARRMALLNYRIADRAEPAVPAVVAIRSEPARPRRPVRRRFVPRFPRQPLHPALRRQHLHHPGGGDELA